MATVRVGTVDLPERIERERYFRELSYLELSLLWGGPVKPGVIDKWKAVAPPGTIGLVAPWVLTQRKPPKSARLWAHDATVGDFRDSVPARAALAELVTAVRTLEAASVVFRSPALFASSAANREQLARFFGEVATAEAIGVERVWVPDGIWHPRTALTVATEVGVTCAFDPLVREPGQPLEEYFDLEIESLYLRISGLGRAGALGIERLEDLVALVEHYEDIPVTIAFESPMRWNDARNLSKELGR